MPKRKGTFEPGNKPKRDPHKTPEGACRTSRYNLSFEMRRLVDALFAYADSHDADPEIVLRCFKEARMLTAVAVKAIQAIGDGKSKIKDVLKTLERRVQVPLSTQQPTLPPTGRRKDHLAAIEIE